MYGVIRTHQFERSFRKLRKSGSLNRALREEIDGVIFQLANRKKLHENYRDHALMGEYEGYRECHIRGDFLLVYRIIHDKLVLVLADIGSHSQMFG